jgi:hypothetical protein
MTLKKLSGSKIVKMAVAELKLHPDNARQGDVGAIMQSLEAHGQYKPIVVQKSTNYVLAGNHTLRAAAGLGWDSVEAVVLDVDDDQALRILLADNRTGDLASYDDIKLVEMLTSLFEEEASLIGTGFSGDDMDDMLARLEEQTQRDLDLSNVTVNRPTEPSEQQPGDQEGVIMTPSLTDYAERYQSATTRVLMADYSNEVYVWLVEQLGDYRAKHDLETNAAAILHLVEQASGLQAPQEEVQE